MPAWVGPSVPPTTNQKNCGVAMTAIPTVPVLAPRAHDEFLRFLPTIRGHAWAAFGAIRCPHDREDAVAEVVANAWVQFLITRVTGAVTAEELATAATTEVRGELVRAARPD
jgi:hypothetical protein